MLGRRFDDLNVRCHKQPVRRRDVVKDLQAPGAAVEEEPSQIPAEAAVVEADAKPVAAPAGQHPSVSLASGFVVIVNEQNVVAALPRAQVSRYFLKKICSAFQVACG